MNCKKCGHSEDNHSGEGVCRYGDCTCGQYEAAMQTVRASALAIAIASDRLVLALGAIERLHAKEEIK